MHCAINLLVSSITRAHLTVHFIIFKYTHLLNHLLLVRQLKQLLKMILKFLIVLLRALYLLLHLVRIARNLNPRREQLGPIVMLRKQPSHILTAARNLLIVFINYILNRLLINWNHPLSMYYCSLHRVEYLLFFLSFLAHLCATTLRMRSL